MAVIWKLSQHWVQLIIGPLGRCCGKILTTDSLPFAPVAVRGERKRRQRGGHSLLVLHWRLQWLLRHFWDKFSKMLCDVYILLPSLDVIIKKFKMHKHWQLINYWFPSTSHPDQVKCAFWPQILWKAWLIKMIQACGEWTWSSKLLATNERKVQIS